VPVEFQLPDVGEGIDAGEIVEWHVAVGDHVTEDRPLVDVQTDKAIVTIPCPATGTVLELCAATGETVDVGATLAVFERDGDHGGRDRVTSPAAAPPAPVPVTATTNGAGAPLHRDSPARPLASPAVRKLARSAGLELAAIRGSGPGGRITRDDVQTAIAVRGKELTAPARPAAVSAPAPSGADEVVPLRGTRRAIARALTQSWQTIPHMIDYREVDATALAATQAALRRQARRRGDERLARALTVTPLIVKMVAAVLPRHPYANASVDLEREEITLRASCNIGIAVAAAQGLVVPVVQRAQTKSAAEIALEVAALAQAARENRLSSEQLAGGTFTVNNYGALGVWLGTPIIAPGQVVNFGLGKLEPRPVVRDGEIVARPIMPIAVSGDHRALDGHTLAALVNDVVELIENPSLLTGELR
jgi:pyruvate/2-oxoglutarate dehydrogenase complex dihydrolipoamide acyltransferase (E2) component